MRILLLFGDMPTRVKQQSGEPGLGRACTGLGSRQVKSLQGIACHCSKLAGLYPCTGLNVYDMYQHRLEGRANGTRLLRVL